MKKAVLLSLVTCLLLPCSWPADAGRGNGPAQGQPEPTQRLAVTDAQQAIQLVKRRYQGKVLKVKQARVNGHPGYKVKLLTDDGMVFYVAVDALNGAVMRD